MNITNGATETYLMNPHVGSVDTADNWAAEGFDSENSELIEVVKHQGSWVDFWETRNAMDPKTAKAVSKKLNDAAEERGNQAFFDLYLVEHRAAFGEEFATA